MPFAILGQDDVAFLLKKLAGEINGLGFAETDLRWRGRGAALEVMLPCGNAPGRNGTLGPLLYKGPCPCPVFAAGSFLFVPFMSRLSQWVDRPLATFRFP